jgi:hypothetical protein
VRKEQEASKSTTMASKKGALDPARQTYRDEPGHAETASMASAVLLDDIEAFPDEELPPYEDSPQLFTSDYVVPRIAETPGLPEGNEDHEGWT